MKHTKKRYLPTRRRPHSYYLLGAIGVILLWRGIWGILDTVLFPEYGLISFGISLLLGLGILYADDFSFKELR
jgi:hypothetical protein